MSDKTHIVSVGVTGGIGSGKSEVCRIFERLGTPVLYADAIARRLSNVDPDVRQGIIGMLGQRAYNADGVLDRAFVASKVFTSRTVQKKINRIVHPRVEAEIEERIAQLRADGSRVAVVEAALMFEAGLDGKLDTVVVVDADDRTKIARIMTRDGLTRREVLDRMNAQLASADKLKKADYIVHNNGTLEELEQKVIFLNAIFHHLADTRP